MRLAPVIERVDNPRRWVVTVPYPAAKPYQDPDRPDHLIVPMTARCGWTRTRWGAGRLVRRLERQIAQEAAAA